MRYVPNVLTIARIVLTPFLLALLMMDSLWGRMSALLLFIIAAISDYLDGQLARRYGVGSRLGRFLDPFADKVLVLGVFATLAVLLPASVPWWAVLIIALRDIVVTGLRTWAEANDRSLRTLPMAKLKTALQLLFLFTMVTLLAAEQVPGRVGENGRWILESPAPFLFLLVVVIATVFTGGLYLFRMEKVTPAKIEG